MIDPYDTRFNQKLLCLAESDPVGVSLLDRFASLFGKALDEDNKYPDEWYVFKDLVEREYERKAADLNLVLNSPFEIGSCIKPLTSVRSYINKVWLYALPVVCVDYCVRGHILSGTQESGTKQLYLSADLTTPRFVERQGDLRYYVVPRSWFRDEEWPEYLVGSQQRKLETIGVIFDRETGDPALRMFQLMSLLYKNSQESILDIIDIFATDPVTRAYSRRIS